MAALTDHQIGCAVESTYGTPVVVSRFLPALDDSSHKLETRPIYGQGMIVGGGGVKRGSRRVQGSSQGSLEVAVELQSRALGMLLHLLHPTSTSTLVSGSTYQQVFTPTRTVNTLPASTWQFGVVRADDAGTVDAHTYAGCTAKGFTISAGDGIPTIKAEFDALSLSTATALAVASYAAAPSLFHHDLGSTALGSGLLTAPTSTALGSLAGSPTSGNVREWEFSVDYGIDIERWNIGTRGRPLVGMVDPSLKLTVEYTTTAERDAYLAGTGLKFVATFTTPEALSAGVATFQLVIPQLFIDESALPMPSNGEVTTVDVSPSVTFDGTLPAWYIVMRTADTAF